MIDFTKFMNTPDTGEEGGGATDTEPDVPTNNCPVCNKPIDECTCGCCRPTPPDCNCGCTPTPPCKPCPELPKRGTPFYHLPQWGPADLCDWFVKMNISMMTIDSALHNMDLKIMRQPGELECRIKQLRADLQDLSDIVTCQGSSLIELKDRMDAVETSTNALQETINNQQLQISNLDTRVTTSELNVAAMQTRVANLDANFSKVTSEFALLKQDFATLNLTVKTIEDAQAAVDTRLTTVEDGLEAEVQRSTTKDDELEVEIDALKQVDDDLIEKDRTLEEKIFQQNGRIQNNSSRIDTLSNEINSARDAIVITQSDIVDLQREDTAIKGRLDSAETDITNLQDKDGVLEQSIAQNTTNITTLTSTVENLVQTEEGHDTRLNNLESRTNANEIELESQDSRIHALEESDMAQGEKITTLEQNEDTMASTIATINDTVGSHTTKIGQVTTKQTQMEEDLELASENATNAKNGVDALTPKVAELEDIFDIFKTVNKETIITSGIYYSETSSNLKTDNNIKVKVYKNKNFCIIEGAILGNMSSLTTRWRSLRIDIPDVSVDVHEYSIIFGYVISSGNVIPCAISGHYEGAPTVLKLDIYNPVLNNSLNNISGINFKIVYVKA